jgi:hypothetical protein
VLLLGETGTGKELLAHAIHAASRRAARPFVGVNIAAVPETLLEAEFFGVAPGAYTGADRKGRDGKFKLADGGTLFLDEIGDMPLALQSKLLRALQEQEVEPLGSNRVERVDVRIVAATSRDLAAMVARPLPRRPVLPAERAADPPAGAARAPVGPGRAGRGAGRGHRAPQRPAAQEPGARWRWTCWPAQPWPGNIRELRNVLEQATLMTDDSAPRTSPAHCGWRYRRWRWRAGSRRFPTPRAHSPAALRLRRRCSVCQGLPPSRRSARSRSWWRRSNCAPSKSLSGMSRATGWRPPGCSACRGRRCTTAWPAIHSWRPARGWPGRGRAILDVSHAVDPGDQGFPTCAPGDLLRLSCPAERDPLRIDLAR